MDNQLQVDKCELFESKTSDSEVSSNFSPQLPESTFPQPYLDPLPMLVLDEVLDHAETNILASTKHGEEKEEFCSVSISSNMLGITDTTLTTSVNIGKYDGYESFSIEGVNNDTTCISRDESLANTTCATYTDFDGSKDFMVPTSFAGSHLNFHEDFGNFNTSVTALSNSNNISPIDEFGDFSSMVSGASFISSNEFRNMSTSISTFHGNMSATVLATHNDNSFSRDEFGEFSSSATMMVESSGTHDLAPVLGTQNDNCHDEFGDFCTTISATAAAPTCINTHDEFGDFNSTVSFPPLVSNDYFGGFTTVSAPITTSIQNDFADVNTVASPERNDTASTKHDVSSHSTHDEKIMSAERNESLHELEKPKELLKVVDSCFPYLSTCKATNTKCTSEKVLLHEKDPSLSSELKIKSSSSCFHYQWHNSLLQNHLYSAIKVDSMLIQASKPLFSGDVSDIQYLVVQQDTCISENMDEGAMLLDLTLPVSPTHDNEKPEFDFVDLLGLDFSEDNTISSESKSVNQVTGWVDSELEDILGADNNISRSTNSQNSLSTKILSLLNNTSYYQQAIVSQEDESLVHNDHFIKNTTSVPTKDDNEHNFELLKKLPNLLFMSANNLIF